MNELKYQLTPDGVHVWRYPDGRIFCAASGSNKLDTNCYLLAKQYVEGVPAAVEPSPSPMPTGSQSGGSALSLVLLLAAIGCLVFGGVTLSYSLVPSPRVRPANEPGPDAQEPVGENPDGSEGSPSEGSPDGHEPLGLGSSEGQESSSESSDDEDELKPSGDEGSNEVQSAYAQLSLKEFKETVPPGNLDPRTLSLAEYREMAKEIVWRFYCQHGVTNRQKLAWICTGATKGGSAAWQLTDQFLKEACQVMFTWGYSPKYSNNQTTEGDF